MLTAEGIAAYLQQRMPDAREIGVSNVARIGGGASRETWTLDARWTEGEATVEGQWADRVVGLDDVRADIAMMRTPDGSGRVELSKFHRPPALRAEPDPAPANTLGMRRIMFSVDDLDDVVARLRRHGAELVGEIAQYENVYRLCFLRGPEGIVLGLAEKLG